jgi:peptidoglycan/LPS O-acetylase OafA/YrhL
MAGPREEYRFRSLDGLRGVAALMVALCHFITAFQWSMIGGDPAASHFAGDVALSHTPLIFFYNSDLCIAIFFILSGFVLAAGVSESAAPLHALIARRWVRLALPVTATSAFAFTIPALGLNFAQAAARFTKSGWLADQYAHVTCSAAAFCKLLAMAGIVLLYPNHGWHSVSRVFFYPEQDWGTFARFYNTSLWTMPVEFAGSIALFAVYRVPFAVGIYGRVCAAGVVSVLLWDTPFFGFPLGVLIFELHRALPRLPAAMLWLPGGCFFALGVLLGATPFEIELSGGGVYATLAIALYHLTAPMSSVTAMHQAGAFCLVVSALMFAPARAVLETRGFQFLGRISFMVYLVQVPVLCLVGAGGFLLLAPRLGYNPATIVAAAAYLAVVLAVATVFTRFIDIPAIRASRRLGAALSARPASARSLLSDSP